MTEPLSTRVCLFLGVGGGEEEARAGAASAGTGQRTVSPSEFLPETRPLRSHPLERLWRAEAKSGTTFCVLNPE